MAPVSTIRSSETVMSATCLVRFLAFTVTLPQLTARKATTIEPTLQEPTSNARALNNIEPARSIMFSTIR
jgi:hypothetical protein